MNKMKLKVKDKVFLPSNKLPMKFKQKPDPRLSISLNLKQNKTRQQTTSSQNSRIPVLIQQYYEKMIYEKRINSCNIIVNSKSHSLSQIQNEHKRIKRLDKMKAVGLMKSIDQKRMSLILQNLEDRPSKFSIAAKNKLIKSKKKLFFTEEGEQSPTKRQEAWKLLTSKNFDRYQVKGQQVTQLNFDLTTKREFIVKQKKQLLNGRYLKTVERNDSPKMVSRLTPWNGQHDNQMMNFEI